MLRSCSCSAPLWLVLCPPALQDRAQVEKKMRAEVPNFATVAQSDFQYAFKIRVRAADALQRAPVHERAGVSHLVAGRGAQRAAVGRRILCCQGAAARDRGPPTTCLTLRRRTRPTPRTGPSPRASPCCRPRRSWAWWASTRSRWAEGGRRGVRDSAGTPTWRRKARLGGRECGACESRAQGGDRGSQRSPSRPPRPRGRAASWQLGCEGRDGRAGC
jgi:hypothetical protein